MIVVVGSLAGHRTGDGVSAGGVAAGVAFEAAAAGARVEVIARIGDDPVGDAVLLSLARAGIGHVATLRDPARGTVLVSSDVDDPPDVDGLSEADDPGPDHPMDARQPAPAPVLDGADAGLALRYLTDFRVIVTVHASADVLAEAVVAAAWAETHLITIVEPDTAVPTVVPADALVVAIAPDDGVGAGAVLGRYAAAIDRGDDPAVAYAALTAAGTDVTT